MRDTLSMKQIFDDFVNKTILTENEKEVLMKYIKRESIIKIAEDTIQSTTSVSKTIAKLKRKYESYKKLEMTKLLLFNNDKKIKNR